MTYQHTQFDNGLRVATEHLPGMESVAVTMSFNVGARQETQAQHGLAHLLEHMAFKGTKTRSARKIAEEFDDIGGQINAYTSMEQTVYYAKVLKEYLPQAFEIIADILQNSVFDEAELKREKDVITQEIGMHQDSPEDLVFDYLHDAAFGEQALGRTILGTPASVASFKAEDLRGFMQAHYHTPSMVIAAAGGVSQKQMLGLVEQHLPGLSTRSMEREGGSEILTGQKRVIADFEQLQVMLAFEAVPLKDPRYQKMQLLSTILGGGMSSRLFQEVREKRGLAYTVQSFLTGYSDCGMLGIYAATGGESARELLPVLVEETARLADGVTEAELQRAKNQMKSGIVMRRESSSAVSEWIARHLQDYGEYRTAEQLIKRIDAVTTEDLRGLASDILQKPNMALATLGPNAEAVELETLRLRVAA